MANSFHRVLKLLVPAYCPNPSENQASFFVDEGSAVHNSANSSLNGSWYASLLHFATLSSHFMNSLRFFFFFWGIWTSMTQGNLQILVAGFDQISPKKVMNSAGYPTP